MQEHEKWLKIAQDDLKGAKIILEHELYAKVAFDCQQAVEKALKGYLAFKGQETIKTHDLVKLLRLCATFDAEFHKKNDAASYINPFSTKFRYPTEYDVLGYDEATLAIKDANSIVKLVLKKIAEPNTGQKNIF